MRADPESGVISPRRIFAKVLLPAPLEPIRPVIPDSTSTVSESRAITEPNRFDSASATISEIAPPLSVL